VTATNPITRALDQALQRAGQTATMRRDGETDLAVRVFVRGYTPSAVAGTIQQGDSHVIMSPTEMSEAGWGGYPVKGDKLILDDRTCMVWTAMPKFAGGWVVRYELVVRG
jgi:hypothetical protein